MNRRMRTMPFKESNNVKLIRQLYHRINTERAMSMHVCRRMFGKRALNMFAENLDKGMANTGLCHSLFNNIQMYINGYQRIN